MTIEKTVIALYMQGRKRNFGESFLQLLSIDSFFGHSCEACPREACPSESGERESSLFDGFRVPPPAGWIPAYAGMTTFYNFIIP